MENPPNTSISEPLNNSESSNANSQDPSEIPFENLEISNQNTQVNSFSFEIQPAWKLEFAIRALCDSTFNSEGLAWIDAWPDDFKFSVWDSEIQFGASIVVYKYANNKYCYNNSEVFNSKMINLKSVLSIFDFAASDDTVTIRHVHGSAELLFKFGTDSEFSVNLIEAESHVTHIPAFNFACTTMIKSKHLVEMIPRLVDEDGTIQTVFVHVKDENLTFNIGVKKWEDKLRPQDNSERDLGVLFEWPHVESLRNAVVLMTMFSIRFESSSDVPAGTLRLNFMVTEGCYLELMSFNRCLNYTFKFQVKQGHALKCALKSLTDSDFIQGCHNYSRPGLGRLAFIEVNDEGCKITVENSDTGVSAFLRFNASDLINFKCITTLEKNRIDIKEIVLYVLQNPEEDILTVFHTPGSNQIAFESGSVRLSFRAQLGVLDADFVGVPLNLNNVCSVKIPSEDLRKLILPMTENKELLTVSLEIEDGFASFSVKQRKLNSYYDPELLGQSHHVSFKWPHPNALMWASMSSEHFLLHLQDDPSDSITLEFDFQVGTLLYQKAVQRLSHA